jgi:Leucine-rich repeat (LRR) protein
MNDILMQQMVMKMMMEQNMNDNQINNEKTATQLKEEGIKHYNSSKNYEIDFTRINHQKDNFTIITKKLSKFIKKLEECVKHNTKIVNEYSSEPLKDENYTNLLKLSCSIEDIYENTLRDFTSISKEIYNIYKSGVQKLKENYIKDFNKKYNANLYEDKIYVGFRDFLDEGNYKLEKLNEVQFKELCRIDFKKIRDLEIKFLDNINIDVLMRASYINLAFLGLFGKTKNMDILSKLPFKSLNTLLLGENSFNNLDLFRNVPFIKLKRLVLSGNKINNLFGLSKAPFFDLESLELTYNNISDIQPLVEIPFKNLEILNLNCNNIENINCLSQFSFPNLRILSLSNNKITNINIFSYVKFHKLDSLLLANNQIKNIDVFSNVSFYNLQHLDLRDNLINNINVLNKVPFTNLSRLFLSHNKIKNYEVISHLNFKNMLDIYVDRLQNHRLKIEIEIPTNIRISISD